MEEKESQYRELPLGVVVRRPHFAQKTTHHFLADESNDVFVAQQITTTSVAASLIDMSLARLTFRKPG